MINQDKIDEWIHEVEERPVSAPIILRYISNRLRDLAARNEELQAENYELRNGMKVDEYESRIANLEYQLELLKRQVSGQMAAPLAETISVMVYNQEGQVLRIAVPVDALKADHTAAFFKDIIGPEIGMVRLLVTPEHEELLFVFDSGRTVAAAVASIPAVDGQRMDWQLAHLQEPVGSEKLSVVVPVARMSMAESIVQSSLRGSVKRMMRSFFESQVAKNYIGTGVKQQPDKTSGLALCAKDELFVMVSREGFVFSMPPSQLPYAIEEALRLRATDYVMSTFAAGSKPAIVFITENGKAVHRELSWLEPAASFKSKGQPVFSQARRDAGTRMAGAACVGENDWGAALSRDGKITLHKVSDIFAAGAVTTKKTGVEILDFAAFEAPEHGQE